MKNKDFTQNITSDLDIRLTVSKVSYNRRRFKSEDDFYATVNEQISLLLKNNYIVSTFSDIDTGSVIIEFSPYTPDNLTAVPIWISPEDFLEYLNYLSEKTEDEIENNSIC